MPDELFLIDGNSLAYRAFFALPESIATSTGMPTNAIFGFASMLVKILTDYGPKATVVVWDAGDTGRKTVYADYKAQRSSRPDLLKEQWPHLEPLVDAFGYKNLRAEGYEADDVIASIAERAKHADPPIPVMVVTGDRDAYQLVDDGVRIMTTSRGITDTKVYDRDGVVDRYGIPPELVPDFIGLKGDTSDNIPGVPGIGDKTAADLLQKFGSLENVLSSIDEISGAKRKQNLTEHADDARISKQLATAKRDIEIPFDLEAYASAEPDRSKLRDTFRQFELREPLRRLEEALGSADAAAPAPEGEQALTATVKRERHARAPSRPYRTPRSVSPRSRRKPRRTRCSPPTAPGASAPTPTAPRTSSSANPQRRRHSSRRSARDRPSPTTRNPSARSRRTSSMTPRSAPTCSSPPGARTRSASSPRSVASRPTSTPPTNRRPMRCSPARSRNGSGKRSTPAASPT